MTPSHRRPTCYIKVKERKLSTAAVMNCPDLAEAGRLVEPTLAFIAYSDEMKAAVLEAMAKNPELIKISIVDFKRDGEWIEEWDCTQ